MATETHVAGLPVQWSGRYIQQRCAWCGAVLLAIDLDNIAYAVEPDEDPKPPATWPVDALVRCTYDGPIARWGDVTLSRTIKEVIEPEPSEVDGSSKVPDDACLRAIPMEDS